MSADSGLEFLPKLWEIAPALACNLAIVYLAFRVFRNVVEDCHKNSAASYSAYESSIRRQEDARREQEERHADERREARDIYERSLMRVVDTVGPR